MKTGGSHPPKRKRTALLPQDEGSFFYTIAADNSSITCHVCGVTSLNPEHVRQRFCPGCFVFHDDRMFILRLTEGYQHALNSPEPGGSRVGLAGQPR